MNNKAADLRIERRYIDAENGVVIDEEEDLRFLRGYAARFNRLSEDLGGFHERLAPGVFTRGIAQDVRALVNHDPTLVLGRTKSGTLKLAQDLVGLRFKVDLPATSYARDLAIVVKRGDVNQCSFSFVVR